jgi:hypothetical protein
VDSTQSKPHTNNFDALLFGLFRSMTVYGEAAGGGALLNSRAWNHAAENHQPVGDCRVCGYPVVGLPTEVVGRITWYSAECTNPNCRHEIVSPNGEILRRSMRHEEMPKGFWDGRTGRGRHS